MAPNRRSQSPQIGANFRTGCWLVTNSIGSLSQSPQIGANFRTYEGGTMVALQAESLNPLKSGQTSGLRSLECGRRRSVQSQSPQIGANFRTSTPAKEACTPHQVSIPSNRGKLPDLLRISTFLQRWKGLNPLKSGQTSGRRPRRSGVKRPRSLNPLKSGQTSGR